MLRKRGPCQSEAIFVLRNMLFQQLCGTKSQTDKDSVRKSNCWGTAQQQDNPSSYESPAPPPTSDHAWALWHVNWPLNHLCPAPRWMLKNSCTHLQSHKCRVSKHFCADGQFTSALTLLSCQKLWFMDTVLWFCPSQFMKHSDSSCCCPS